MPILAREPDQYPLDLLQQSDLGQESDRQWLVVHTKPRQEKTLARQLTQRQISHFLPQVRNKLKTSDGRVRLSYSPLFPGYVFVYGCEEDRGRVLSTRSAAHVLEVPNGAQLTFDLRQIERLTHSDHPFATEEHMKPGTLVRITTGPFSGFEGQILQRRSGRLLLIAVHYLQRGISVELGDCEIEKL